jgi:hypothetical protein
MQSSSILQNRCARLVKTIWGLKICPECLAKSRCLQDVCSADRLTRLKPFLRYFLILGDAYGLEDQNASPHTPPSYDLLFDVLDELVVAMQMTKESIRTNLLTRSSAYSLLSPADQGRMMGLALRILLMMDSPNGGETADELESGNGKTPWASQETLPQFLSKRLPQSDHPLFTSDDWQIVSQTCKALKARTLRKRARLKFRLTEDMARHLYLDRKSYTVEIFHCTSFLKEHLIMTRHDSVAAVKR